MDAPVKIMKGILKSIFTKKRNIIQYKNFIVRIFNLNYPMKIKITCSEGNFKGLSVSLNQRGVNKFLAIPIHKSTNRIIDIENFWGMKGTQLINSITNKLITLKNQYSNEKSSDWSNANSYKLFTHPLHAEYSR